MHAALWTDKRNTARVGTLRQLMLCRSAGESRVVYTSHGMLQWHMFTQGLQHTRRCRGLIQHDCAPCSSQTASKVAVLPRRFLPDKCELTGAMLSLSVP